MAQEALLIIDMSNDFVADDGSLTAGRAAQQIVPYIVHLAKQTLADGQVVAICMDTHQPNDDHFREWPPHNVEGAWGHQVYGELGEWYDSVKGDPNVWFIPKTSYNAFYQTGLADKLRECGVNTVHITGVCTDICDFMTAAGAYDEGFKTVAHRRGCATFTNHHDTFLHQMTVCFHTELVD
ncbi:cysteine hydrolase family protein [Alicyclobacillus fastidiosus]|uniref:Isochorismatase family cysteine hydrolase n=1 Tax=Alicyclobacillus fastidiosus TaxID=392011 RepID=A0ABV5AD74_9BACL|nr:isochorismatase family cysteine hydrolase [Alicyclobacillus fastidiosus]WEH08755.1 cysteine hydrolase [Alicyclobacillus fastidiosus]